jgi:hypothetical protein
MLGVRAREKKRTSKHDRVELAGVGMMRGRHWTWYAGWRGAPGSDGVAMGLAWGVTDGGGRGESWGRDRGDKRV